jgi:hypothetical protein
MNMKQYIVFVFTLLMLWSCQKDAISSGTGTGGSLARFTIVNDKMYIVTTDKLKTFDIKNPKQMQQLSEIPLGGMNDIETIFSFENRLFIGSRSALYLFELNSVGIPKFARQLSHSWGCDPVVANDSAAFVTTRSGRTCFNRLSATNQLIVYDVKDLNNARQVTTLSMTYPNGVGLDKNLLFVCDDGVRIFDITKPTQLRQIKYMEDLDAVDVIPLSGQLLIIGEKKLTQLNYKDTNNIKVISEFELKK